MAEITPGTQFIGMAPGLDLKERRSASNNSKTEVYTLEDIQETVLDLSTPPSDGDVLTYDAGASAPVWSAPSGGGSEYTETIVNISSAQILNFNNEGTNAVSLLSDILPNKHLIDRVDIFWNEGNIAYELPLGAVATRIKFSDNIVDALLRAATIDVTQSTFIFETNTFTISGNGVSYKLGQNGFGFWIESIDENGDAVESPLTTGNGTLTFKIYHKTITFGA
jgi:hypothetical protein